MQRRVDARSIALPRVHHRRDDARADRDAHEGADTAQVLAATLQRDRQRVAARCAHVLVDERSTVRGGDDDVEVSVGVEVDRDRTAPRRRVGERRLVGERELGVGGKRGAAEEDLRRLDRSERRKRFRPLGPYRCRAGRRPALDQRSLAADRKG